MASAIPIPKKGSSNAFVRGVSKVSNINILSIFDPPKRRPAPRSVLVNVPLPAHAARKAPLIPLWKSKVRSRAAEDESGKDTIGESRTWGIGSRIVPTEGWIFESNQVLTSKYNIFTFLPRNLLEQFRRVANVFFLALVILQFFSLFSTVSPFLAALPLIVVLAISGLKDGYEDLKRHQSDRSINSIKVHALRGQFHNPNLSHAKSRSFGLPNFLNNFFLKRALKKEAEEAEEDRTESRKKGFWGKRQIRRPTLKGNKSARASFNELESPRDDSQDLSRNSSPPQDLSNKDEASPEFRPSTSRLEGDYYAADDNGAPAHHGDHTLGNLLHAPDLGEGKELYPDRAVWLNENWEDLKVGDFVRLRCDESVPADIVICATSEEENVCYVETKNLDGETNLKSRQAVPELTHLRTSSIIASEAKFTVESEPADVNMFQYNAAVILHDGRLDKHGQILRCPVTLNTVLLRGTVVRNTDWVIGVIVMTGRDTKIVLNTGGTPSKRSKVERQMNPMVLVNLLLLALMSTMCGVVNHILEVNQAKEGVYWIYNADGSANVPGVNGLITFANALITFQNIVPISLYISIEFVRLLQAYFIWADNDIMYRTGAVKRRTTARSWNLSDDLGQIEYVFSDKTGTLTQNVMLFRQCSVGGKVYAGSETASSDSTAKDDSLDSASRIPSGQSGPSSSEADMEKKDNDPDSKKKSAAAASVFRDNQVESDLAKRESTQAMNLYAFFSNLALCHTVLASDEDGLIAYKAQSPDEAALVQAAADVGFVFLGRDKDVLRLQTPHDDHIVEFRHLHVLEFSSVRKRMSVILRRIDDDSLVLLSKGADNVIFERLTPGDDDLKTTTDKHLEEFASQGLRTLCLAYKPLDEQEYEAWLTRFEEASTLIEGREKAVASVSDEIEQNLVLLGATAIEDRLQDGVPEAIAALKRAGLKVWVATGDKLETAIAIGQTCNLLSRDMNTIIIRGGAYGEPRSAYSQMRDALEKFFPVGDLVNNLQNQPPDFNPSSSAPRRSESLRRNRRVSMASGVSDIVGEDNGSRPGGYGLVIDGGSLGHAFNEEYTKDLLLELATRCRAVICCRTSPLQKALMVRLVKEGLGAMCLAIGDGANDVSMIQAADIGVGVAGEEGLQAVNSSDYAIGQFRFLTRLLLVHGHWSYMRNSNMIVNFFYKEIIGIGVLFWFQFYCDYSSTTVYEYTYLLFWNVFWTLVPVIAIGVFDRNVEDKVLMAVPELYQVGSGGQLFGLFRFGVYMLDGIYQSVIVYFFLLYTYDTTTARSDGYSIGLYEFSTVMAIAAVLAANLYNGLNTHSWNWWVFGGVLIGPFLILAYTAVYSAFPPSLIWTYVYGNNSFLWPSAYFWFGMIFTILLSLLPRYLYRYYSENYFASDVDILAWLSRAEPNHDWVNDPYMPQPLPPAQFEKEPSPNQAPVFSTAFSSQSRPSYDARDSFQLGRVMTSASITHDMSTGSTREGAGRGYGFDQADGMQPPEIRRYTSRTSENSAGAARPRPRKGSIRLGPLELNLNPFRSPGGSNRPRSGSMRQALFGGNRRSVIEEAAEPVATSPTRQTRRGRGRSGGADASDAAVLEESGNDDGGDMMGGGSRQ